MIRIYQNFVLGSVVAECKECRKVMYITNRPLFEYIDDLVQLESDHAHCDEEDAGA